MLKYKILIFTINWMAFLKSDSYPKDFFCKYNLFALISVFFSLYFIDYTHIM